MNSHALIRSHERIFTFYFFLRYRFYFEYVTLNAMNTINSDCYINRAIKYNKILFYSAMSEMSKTVNG